MPASAVGALGEASYTVTANVTDSAGNSNSASHNVQVNTALPGVTINPVATDDIINAAESGNAQTISGQVTGAAAGDTVTVTLGGKTYTATVQGNLSWSVDVPAADIQAIGNGNLTVNASVTNGVGNTGSGSRDITIDANLPGLRVDTVAGDDVVNSIEHAQALVITGSSSGLAAGAALTVVINTVTYAATVLADGTWSVGVPAADVSNWPAGTVNITVSGTNTAGTTSTITHPVTVDLAAVAISINTVSGDDVINAAEKGADLTLSGSTSGVEVGQTVTVTFGGKTYTATVAGDGSWTTTVPAADLSVLRDGDATVQASVSTINGNTASATHAYSVDATAPTLAINTIATDDILNAAEAGNPLTISGSSTAEAGQTVTVTLNGVTYSGSVQADGSWSVSLPTADLSNLTASQYTVSASVSDKAGNPASANHGLAVDLTVPVLTINTVSGDDIINAAEHGQALVISGSSTGGEAGDVITVTLNSKTYTTMLDASGNWSVGVPAADVTALGSGPQTITAAITDAAGNSDDASRTVTVNLAAPTIGINTIATDDVIKATEKGADLQITGTSNQPAGTTITVTLNGQNYTATTDSNGNWSATVPASAVSALGEANYTVTANVTDTAGNSNSASHNVLVNSALPAVTINAVATDDIINAAESGNAQTISGQVTGAAQGDTVTVTLGGNTYTATVQSNLSWSVDVPAADIQALGNGDLTVNASVTNGVGNTGSGSRDITIDANLPGLRVDTVAGDDVINSIEHNQALVITGSSSGLTAGTALTVEINNVTYGATVLADGTWSLGVPAVDVSNWPAGTVNITVSGTNSAGTTSTITHPVTVDLAGVAITINTLSGDDVINAVEKGETLVVSGSTSGVEAGQTVTVTFGGKNYTTTVEANGSWTVNVPPADLAALPDGAGNVQASVSNINGNSAQADRAYSVDATAPLVTINTIASDDILNVSEAGAGITISGTTTAQAGQTLTVTLNNNTYQTTVLADGTWSVNVPAADLSGLTASSYTVTATVSDKAGNPASADHALVVDITAPDLTINTVAGDDIINAIEHGQALVVSGTSTGAAAGDVVTVTLNGKNYTTTLDASGNWSVGIPAADVTALATGSQTITASLSDRAGNSDSTTHDVTVDLSGPTLTINTVSGDDIINAAEIVVAQTISGQVTGTAVAGNTVIVTIGGNQYNATVQSDLSWSVSVPANVLQALGNGELTISASLTNSANNTGTATHDIVIDANLPGLRVDTVAGDDVINSIEHTQALVITGSSSGLAAGAALTVVINSVTYGATVLADGSWSVGVPVADVTNWPAGTVNIAVSGTNTAGTTTSISHPVTVDLAAVAITINTLSTDDVINAAEKGSDLQLSGTTSGVEAGQTITVIFGGKSYTTTVAADNTWGLTIPAVDVATLPDGAANVQASVSNVAGNSTQATHAYSVDATAPSVTINTIATDDILNAAEAGSALTISGTSTAEAGQTVTVTLNGVNYSGNVQADGSWSVSVPTGDLASLTASSYTVNASVSDKARNSASATHNLTVDLAAPVVTINTVAGDDIINATEHGQAQIISGSATGATTGNTVSVTIGTTTYTTVLDANGNWSIGVPASVISALAQGDVTITATVTDSAGNSGTASHTVTVALGAPVLAINTIAVDDIINAAEKGADLAITGTSNQPAGTQITVTLNGQNYTTTADASGNWSVTVPASRVSALGEATYTVTAAATDADGNSGSASHNVQVNTALPGVTINVVATDDIINAAEAGVEQTISGQVTGAAAGDTVTVTLGGATYTATVQANLSWSVDVPASALQELGNGELTISASVTNSVGNTGNGTREITIDANLPGLRVDTVAGDDVVNIIEHGQALVITGSSSGLAAGSNVTLTINGQTYVAAVLADGTWSVGVPAVDVSAWPAGSVTIAASGSTSAGNPVSVTHPVTVDLSAVAVSINAITADDVINAAEKGAALTLSGSTSGVEAGQTVTVTFGGKTYSATVAANGSWSTSVPAADMAALRDGDASAQASVSNVNGNSATTTHAYSVDASAPTVTINTIAGDDILNAAEAGAALTITGSSTAEAGQTVTVTLNGTNYTGTVQTDGSWSVSVPSADLSTLTASNYTVNAAVSDKAGNPASVNHNLTVDTSVPVVTINTVAGDDVINATEHAQAQIISGSATGAATGSTVTVTIGTNTFTTVLDASGNWSVGVPASVVSALANGTVTINASVTDAGGNSGSATHQVTVNTGLPTITFNAISGDNILNADEKGQPLTISGGSTGLATGAQVTVTLNGHNYSATTDASGNWTLTVPVSDLAALGQANYTVSASATSAAGNTASSQANLLVDSGLPDVTINTVAGDDIINAAEAGADQTISGVVTRAAAGDTVTVTLGGNTYTATVQSNLSWSVSVPTADLQALGNGDLTITASVTNANGNTGSGTRDITIDANLPGLRVDTVAGDDIINDAEHAQALVISGTSSGGEAGDVVSVVLNGKTYTTTLDASGNWSVGVPAADVTALGSGAQTITASVSDRAGNSDDASRTVTVSLSAPVISINTIAGDDVINATEKGSDLALSGTSDQPAGTAITVTLNGQNYSATTDASGNWSVTVPASAVSALGEATYSVTASVTNAQGNSSTASHNVQVNTALPGITINPVATDDIINASEAGSAQTISGQVTGAAAGSTVTVELGGKTYTATVQADLSWNVSVPAADWQALGNGELTVNASVTNAVGNTGSGTRDITIDASLPGLRVDTVAGDDVVNIIEHAQAQVITGSSSGFAAGTALTVVINNQTYAATVLANGSWSVGVPATDVSNWPAGTLNITVSGANSAGTQTSITHPLTVDLTAVAISMNSITSDDAINAAEKGAALTLSGSTSGVEAGQTVTVTFGGKTYTTTVAANGSWSTTVPAADLAALRDGDASAQVRVTNVNGNSATATHEYSVDSAAPTVTINTIASDNIINASEAAAGVTVSGTSTAQTGQTLTVTLNGTNYQTTVQTDGSWSLTLPASDLTALANNGYTLTATVSDLAGNLGSASKGVTVDTTAPVISFNTVAGDDVINNVEHIQAQIISGTATGAVAGDRLVVTIAGQQYVTSTDASGNWSVGVPASVISGLADGTVTISATITDSAGNSSTQTHNVQVNTAAVSLSVSTISGDNLINAAEAGSALTLSGTGTNFATGTVVTVLLNGKGYSATIQSNGSWSVNVPAADVAALSDGTSYTVSASAQDSAGNSATASRSVAVDLTAPVISINTVSTDDRLNAAEQQQPLTLNGSTSAEVGQTVTVTFGGKTYTATVAANGTWALNVPAVDLAALGQGAQTITASVNDRAGNPGQATHALTVDTVAPTVTIATVAGDDIINNAEQLAGQTISGTTTAEVGQTVTVTFNGQTWSATVGSGGSWSVFIPAQQFAGLSDGSYTISATVSDQAGNPGSASRGVTLNGDVPTVTINTFAGDDVVNAAEHGSSLVISGTTTAPVGQTLTLTLNGKTYTTTVQTGGSWSYTLGSADVTALADGNAYVINASVSNAIGNTGSSNHTITVDLSAPAMGINIDSLQADTGLSASDFITSVSPVVVNGSLTAALASNETAQISIDGGTTWTTLTVTGTTWRYNDSRTLTDGNYLYQVRVIDAAGNVGATDSQNVVIDTTAPDPAVKTIAISAITTDMGLITNDFVTSDTTLAVSGTLGATLSAGEFAQISLDGGVTWTTLTVVGTSWSYADGHTLTDGTWNYTVRVVDLAGNVGQTATQNVVVDTTSPEAAKSITITGISDDTGTSSSDFITSDTTLTVRGVLGAALGANEFAQISTDNGATWVNVTVAADSLNWSYVDGRTLTNGTTTWQVRVVDLAGNVGATSSQSALIDTVNPAQVLTIASISTDTGSSATDFITSDTMLTLTGSLGAGLASGEVAQISLDSGATWTTLTTNGTQWTYTDSRTLTDGSYVYQVRVLDLAGNTGPVVSKTVVVDTINPTATPTIVSYTDDVGQRQGTLSSSQATDDTTPLLNGVLSAPLASGEVVYLYRNGLLLGAVTMVGALNWTYSDSGLVSGAYTYSARVVDLAGNITSSSDFVLTVDTSIPTTLAQITSQTTRDTTPIISGVITAALASGQYVEVVINGKTYTSEPGGAVVVDPAHNTWYVQLPDTDALTVSATAYTVTAQVKSSAGNGNNANISNGTVTVNAAIDYTPTWTTASKTTAWGLTYGLDSHGMWTVLANQQVMQSTDPLTWSKTALTLYQSGNNYATSSIADYDRNGTGDLFITRDDYGTGYINGFTNNGDGTFSSAIQVTVGTLTWYGSIVAFDKEGDGYLDFWIGDAGGPDSNTFLWNNAGTLVGNSTTSNSGGSATVGGAVTGYLSLNEGSGVDLNNDGRIDLVQHTYNLNNYYTLSSLINQGNGTFVWGQNTTNTFLSGAGSGAMSSSVSMTWADFDGDGDMDLFLPASQGRANYGSLLFNTNGVLGSPVAVGATATTYASQFSLAVDWNHDGLMDIARIAQTGQSYLYTNVSNASNWTQSALGGSQSGTTSGVAAMDYDWDGAVDVLVSKQSGSVFLSRNTNTVSYGTSLHLRITDPNGINVYYGNTVKLYNSAGVLVATQIINPQSGMGVNDTSALVNFYGLNAGETYNAVLIKSTGTTASNIDQTVNTSWGGLQATDATHAYDLSAEAGTASNNGKFVGTGYNDTFFATAGTDTYDGSGGWVYSSGTGTWLANGGMDVVDFRLSTVGVTANLSSTAAQATGFNTSTFTNIEGISGSNFNDILTGSSGDNQLEGRGGNDTLNIGNGGHDTLLYKLLNASDATGGNGSDVVNGFTVGTWEGTADTDRIDIRELLQGSGYTGNGKASYVNGVATLDAQAGNIGDFVKVTQSGSDTIVQIDRDGTGGTFATTNVVTLTGVHTDLATLLANHQLMVV
ncbi:Ig-like domain-containing protein [Escherichia coli]|nr:Ig-like domain-containing protein [Escherichia coli]